MCHARSLTAAAALAILAAIPLAHAGDPSWDWAEHLDRYESKLAASPSQDLRFCSLDEAAFAALMVGELEKAKGYADEALELAPKYRRLWSYGNAIHHGHLVRGHLAILQGDVLGAEKELLAAGKTPGSPQLDTFGPNMALAKSLLERGRKTAVLAYFEECRRFWSDDLKELDLWKAAVEKGEIPDFGSHLLY